MATVFRDTSGNTHSVTIGSDGRARFSDGTAVRDSGRAGSVVKDGRIIGTTTSKTASSTPSVGDGPAIAVRDPGTGRVTVTNVNKSGSNYPSAQMAEALAAKAPTPTTTQQGQTPPATQQAQQQQRQIVNTSQNDDGGLSKKVAGLTRAQVAMVGNGDYDAGMAKIRAAMAENDADAKMAPGTQKGTVGTTLTQDSFGQWGSDGDKLATIKAINAASQNIDLSGSGRQFAMKGNETVVRDANGKVLAKGFINPVTGQIVGSYNRGKAGQFSELDPNPNSANWGSLFLSEDGFYVDPKTGQQRPYTIADTWRDYGVPHTDGSYATLANGQVVTPADLASSHGQSFAYLERSRLGEEAQKWADQNTGTQAWKDAINANSANNGLTVGELATPEQAAAERERAAAVQGQTTTEPQGQVLSQTIVNPNIQGFNTFVMRGDQKLAATITPDGKTILKDGGQLQAGDVIQGREKQFTVSAEKAAQLSGGQAQPTNNGAYQAQITLPDGTPGTGYIINGQTFLDPQGTQRVPGGTKVIDRQGREWTMKDAGDGSVKQELTPSSMLNMLMDGYNNPVDYNQIVSESAALFAQMFPDSGVSMPTWEQAMKDAAAAMADIFAMQDEELARATDQGLLANGLFGQIPGEVIKRELMTKQKGIQGQTVAGMAQNIYQTGAQNAQWEKQYQLQKQQQFLSVLNAAYERAVGQKVQNQNLILQMYNILTQQQSAAAQAAMNERQYQLDLMNYELDKQRVLNDTNYTNARIGDILASKSGGSGGSSGGGGRGGSTGGGGSTSVASFVESKLPLFKTPQYLMNAIATGKISGMEGLDREDVINYIKKVFPNESNRNNPLYGPNSGYVWVTGKGWVKR